MCIFAVSLYLYWIIKSNVFSFINVFDLVNSFIVFGVYSDDYHIRLGIRFLNALRFHIITA